MSFGIVGHAMAFVPYTLLGIPILLLDFAATKPRAQAVDAAAGLDIRELGSSP